jgi:hypothetical protein
MPRVPVEVVSDIDIDSVEFGTEKNEGRAPEASGVVAVEVEVEREITKRRLIESITQVVMLVLYMVFTLIRESDQDVVVMDKDDAGDDWEA